MNLLSQVANHKPSASEQLASTAEELGAMAVSLRDTMASFKVDASASSDRGAPAHRAPAAPSDTGTAAVTALRPGTTRPLPSRPQAVQVTRDGGGPVAVRPVLVDGDFEQF